MKITNDYVLFWDGVFSNWWAAWFTVNDKPYSCVEQYMMEQKALLFGDTEAAEKIMETAEPSVMKALGRKVKGYDEEVWDGVRYMVVYRACYAKFSQHESLKRAMAETGYRLLVEASPYDKIWGIGLGEDNPKALNKETWRGLNLLGEVLTQVRDDMIAEGLI